MKRYLFIFTICLVFGCATKTIRVVDVEGNPVAGALVFSQQLPFILQPWTIGAYETDEDGKAEVVSNSGYILKRGYFPVIDGYDVGNVYLWGRHSEFSGTTTIYPIIDRPSVNVEQSSYITDAPVSKNTFQVPLHICVFTNVEYNVEDSSITVQSENRNIVPSKRFFFLGPDGNDEVAKLREENNVSFYCHDNGNLYKVGISVSIKVWRLGRPNHELIIFTAKIPSKNTYIQPPVKCIDERDVDNFSIGNYRDEEPTVYASTGIKRLLNGFNSTIPCANKNSDELLKYVQKYL